MVNRDLWFELGKFHSDLAAGRWSSTTNKEILLKRALKLLRDIYAYEHTAKYN